MKAHLLPAFAAHNVQRSAAGSPLRLRGFTLIELMIVVAVVAVLAAIALPSYQDSVRKGRRGQAKSDLVELAQRAERYRTVNSTYTGFTVAGTDAQSPREGAAHYTVAASNVAANTFRLTATPVGGQTGDTRCMALSINQAGVKTEAGTATTITDCW